MKRILADYRLHPTVNRKFWAILALSVLLHGGLFALTTWQRQVSRATPLPLLVSLRLMPEAARPAPSLPAAAPAPVVAAAAAPRPLAAPRPASVAPVVAPSIMAPPLGAVAGGDGGPVEPARAPASPAPASEAPRLSAPPVPASPDALAAYRRQLAELFARLPEYPRIAAMRGWEGEVRLRLKVARKGNLIGIALDRSSGFEVLDQHALALLEGHGSLPPLPEALEASEIQVVVPIHYKLKKTT